MPSSVLPSLLSSPRRRGFARITRRYRRPLAAALLVLAVASLIRPVAEARGVTGSALVLSRPLAAGEVIGIDDVVEIDVPADTLPDDALTDLDQMIGARLSVAASAREILTPSRLVAGAGSLAPGKVVAPVRIADTQAAALVRVGDLVDVLAASSSRTLTEAASEPAATVAAGARVVGAPAAASASAERRGGLFDATTSGFDGGGLVLLAVDDDTAARLAGAAASSRLSIVLRPEN